MTKLEDRVQFFILHKLQYYLHSEINYVSNKDYMRHKGTHYHVFLLVFSICLRFFTHPSLYLSQFNTHERPEN